MLWQCAQKYALTEGERLVIVALTGMTEQGVYALVSNLGSLVARLVLQPVEEATFAHYSRLAAAAPPDAAALRRMVALVRAAAIFGGVFAAFGPAYSWLLLRLLYGPLWSSTDAPSVLQAYCAHVCAIALNGVTEAFVHATATRDELQKLKVLLVALSVAYVPAAAVGLTTLGARGLIAANCANVALRTAYSLRFIRRRVDGAAAKEDGGAAEVRMLPHPPCSARSPRPPPPRSSRARGWATAIRSGRATRARAVRRRLPRRRRARRLPVRAGARRAAAGAAAEEVGLSI